MNPVARKKNNHAENPAFRFALRVLRPSIQVFLRFGVTHDILNCAIRWLYMDNCREYPEFWHRGKTNDSRVATLTGLTRRSLIEFREFGTLDTLVNNTSKGNRASRVLAGWMQDPRFLCNGRPLVLPWRASKGPSFYQLTKEYSGDVPVSTIAEELIRNGSIERRSDDTLKLIREAFVPQNNIVELLDVEGICSFDFLTTIARNLEPEIESERRLFQRECFDDKVPVKYKAALEMKIRERLSACRDEINDLIRDIADRKPRANIKYCRVGVGLYQIDNSAPE